MDDRKALPDTRLGLRCEALNTGALQVPGGDGGAVNDQRSAISCQVSDEGAAGAERRELRSEGFSAVLPADKRKRPSKQSSEGRSPQPVRGVSPEPETRYRVAIKRPLARDEPAVGISLDN